MEEAKSYKFDELIPVVKEFMTHLKELGKDAEISQDFLDKHPWVKNIPRKDNLRKLAESDRLIVDLMRSAHSMPVIRISDVDIRHREDGAHTDTLLFMEVKPEEFIYIPR